MTPDEYRVEVRVEVIKLTPGGGWTNERMTFTDATELGSLNFQQIADLLQRFHDLSVSAKKVP